MTERIALLAPFPADLLRERFVDIEVVEAGPDAVAAVLEHREPAACCPAQHTWRRSEYGLTAEPPPGCSSKCRWGVPRALPVSPFVPVC